LEWINDKLHVLGKFISHILQFFLKNQNDRVQRHAGGVANDYKNRNAFGDSKSRFFFVFQQLELKQNHSLTK